MRDMERSLGWNTDELFRFRARSVGGRAAVKQTDGPDGESLLVYILRVSRACASPETARTTVGRGVVAGPLRRWSPRRRATSLVRPLRETVECVVQRSTAMDHGPDAVWTVRAEPQPGTEPSHKIVKREERRIEYGIAYVQRRNGIPRRTRSGAPLARARSPGPARAHAETRAQDRHGPHIETVVRRRVVRVPCRRAVPSPRARDNAKPQRNERRPNPIHDVY